LGGSSWGESSRAKIYEIGGKGVQDVGLEAGKGLKRGEGGGLPKNRGPRTLQANLGRFGTRGGTERGGGREMNFSGEGVRENRENPFYRKDKGSTPHRSSWVHSRLEPGKKGGNEDQ